MTPNFAADGATGWTLRYAPHVGYLTPDEPLFKFSVGDCDPAHHAAFAASQGFAGLLHPWIASKSESEINQFGEALRRHELEAGCIVYAALDDVLRPTWVRADETTRRKLLHQVSAASSIAVGLGSKTLAVLIRAQAGESMNSQLSAVRDNLRFAADEAARHGLVLGIEPLIALPEMLFQSTYDAADLLNDLDHPGARLIFDTGHVSEMDGDVLAAQAKLHELVCVYQLADQPGRIEPGAGTIDFAVLLERLHRESYAGLVELEHGWSLEGVHGEAAGLAALRKLDASAMVVAGGQA